MYLRSGLIGGYTYGGMALLLDVWLVLKGHFLRLVLILLMPMDIFYDTGVKLHSYIYIFRSNVISCLLPYPLAYNIYWHDSHENALLTVIYCVEKLLMILTFPYFSWKKKRTQNKSLFLWNFVLRTVKWFIWNLQQRNY